MTHNYHEGGMKQYFRDVVSFPTLSNYCPLSHESGLNDRMQRHAGDYVLSTSSVYAVVYI